MRCGSGELRFRPGCTVRNVGTNIRYRQATCRDTLEGWSNKVKQSPQNVFRYQNTTGIEQKCLGSVIPCGNLGINGKDKAWKSAEARKTL